MSEKQIYVLYISDDKTSLSKIKKWFEKNYSTVRIVTTSSIPEFLGLIGSGPYHCALIDSKIVTRGGEKLVQTIRDTTMIPLIYCTHKTEIKLKDSIMFDYYILNDFDKSEINNMVKKIREFATS